ncbi:oxidoreductase [Labrys miyagiensis]
MYKNKLDLTGRHALVTGGGRGIGLACAEALVEFGAKVVIADFDMKVAEEGQAALAAKGYTTEIVQMDVTKPEQVTQVADDLASQGRTIEILVNNAGIARSMTPAETVADEHWLNVIDVNLNGVFWCCRAFGKHMLAAGKGSIVNIGSMSGFIVNKPQEQSYYNASKAAVHHLTKSLAAEWAPRGVRVNAVAPTYINTPLTAFAAKDPNNAEMFKTWLDMTPMGRMGEVDEIASTVQFLASDAASLLTGSIVVADGGYTCW